MNMHVDSKRIRAERERRAWSQEHLASVAGVSLRTIQRVEGTGLASYDTAQALAAVLEIGIAELRVVAPAKDAAAGRAPRESAVVVPFVAAPANGAAPDAGARTPRRRYWGIAASLALMLAAALFGGRVAYAQQVQLAVELGINEEDFGPHTLLTGAGEDAEIRLEGRLKLVVVPTVARDGNISLAIRMYEYADDRFTLVSEPKLLAADNDEVELKLTSKRGNVFRVAIKPHRVVPGAPPPG